MSTVGQFSSKNPTIKRILKEASELANQPSSDYTAAPLEADLFEWHFTIRGPPAPSAFDGGLYHGRIVLPPAYPLKPPSFRFLTPTGRFEVNREICLSISGHHEETWQPAWGIRTALVAIRSFMDTDAKGQLGGMESPEEVRKRLASQSRTWSCSACGKSNEAVMKEQEELANASGGQVTSEEKELVPEELRLAYREGIAQSGPKRMDESDVSASNGSVPETQVSSQLLPSTSSTQLASSRSTSADDSGTAAQQPSVVQSNAVQQQQRAPRVPTQTPARDEDLPPWIDKAIYGIVAALIYLVWRKFLGGSEMLGFF